MERLFSIIIPCYNASEYIDRVMGSVMDQTIEKSKYEVIAVNDASTDDTLALLNEWHNRYPDTIKVITYEENLRQGGARNIAIKRSQGEYLCFIDADDWMEPDALEIFNIGISEERCDTVTAKYKEDYEYSCLNDKEKEGKYGKERIEKIYTRENIEDYISADLGYVWSSVYKKDMVISNDVWFPEHLAYEDIYWQRLIRFYSQRACIIDAVTHHHYNHPESTMNKKNAAHHVNRLTCYEMLLEQYDKRNLLGRYYPQILKDTMETYVFNSYFMFFTIMDDTPDVYGRIRETVYRYFPDWETSYDSSDIPIVFQYLLKFIAKAKNAKPADLQPFKDSMLEAQSESE